MLTRASKWIAGAWVFIFFTLLLSMLPYSRIGAADEGQYWAVVVGISEYADSNLDVGYTARSAIELHEQMASIWGDDHTKLLVDSEATKLNIHTSIIDWLGSKAGANDTVLFFFTGHGDEYGPCDYLCAYDKDISDIELNDWLNNISSSAQIIMLDSCHSGGFIEELSGENRIVMTACGAEQHANTLITLGYSIFPFCILQAFKNLDDANIRNDGLISAEEIYEYADSQVPRYIGENQIAQFYDGYPGELRLLDVPITSTEVVFENPPSTGIFSNGILLLLIIGTAGLISLALLFFVVRSKLSKQVKNPQ